MLQKYNIREPLSILLTHFYNLATIQLNTFCCASRKGAKTLYFYNITDIQYINYKILKII